MAKLCRSSRQEFRLNYPRVTLKAFSQLVNVGERYPKRIQSQPTDSRQTMLSFQPFASASTGVQQIPECNMPERLGKVEEFTQRMLHIGGGIKAVTAGLQFDWIIKNKLPTT